jgi:MraZ protein
MGISGDRPDRGATVGEPSTTSQATGGVPWAFTGSFERAVDAKGRFNLPFPFRRGGPGHADERYVVAEGPDGTLNILPYNEFVDAFNRVRQRRPGRGLRDELRRLSHNSRVLEPDAQGRIAVPLDFLARIGVTKRILVIGMGNYLELWEPDRWREHAASLGDPDQELLDEFFA